MTNRQVYDFRNNFSLFNDLEGFDFVKKINLNLPLCEAYITALNATISESEEYKSTYGKELDLLKNEYGDRNEKGNLIMDKAGNFTISNRIVEFSEKLTALQTTYKKVFDIQENRVNQFNARLDDVADVKLFKIQESEVPKNIKSIQMKIVFGLIEFV